MTTACAVGASTSAALQGRARRSASRRGAALVCAAAPHSEQQQSAESSSRRTALLGAAGLALGAGLSGAAPQVRGRRRKAGCVHDTWACLHGFVLPLVHIVTPPNAHGLPSHRMQLAAAAPSQPVPVGDYLPAAPGMPGFCIYKPDSKKVGTAWDCGSATRLCRTLRGNVDRPGGRPCFYRKRTSAALGAASPSLSPPTHRDCSHQTVAIRAGVIKPDPDYYSFALVRAGVVLETERRGAPARWGGARLPACRACWTGLRGAACPSAPAYDVASLVHNRSLRRGRRRSCSTSSQATSACPNARSPGEGGTHAWGGLGCLLPRNLPACRAPAEGSTNGAGLARAGLRVGGAGRHFMQG